MSGQSRCLPQTCSSTPSRFFLLNEILKFLDCVLAAYIAQLIRSGTDH
ncbi:hypothetical protein P5V78_02045 [Mycobacteroides abscessus subsp. abscessus]|nr:hypothetical protein [Mycobacteroides abscessus]MBN7400042.1 hypothetical protein [Mycobacteroides abscessus subsp. abscessus]MDO3086747.1 hypothetical protein [Mycobacteroides abscessus subsp. abscessus]MDO3269663.1 hypothetical protein [Mycobacteroides abscessus subsp. abscessus]